MKRIIFSLSAVVALAILISGCSKESELLRYSTLGASADRTNIGKAVSYLGEELDGLSRTPFVLASREINEAIDTSASLQHKMVHHIVSIGLEMGNTRSLQHQFSTLIALATENCTYMSDLWDNCRGIWEWMPESHQFEHSSDEGHEIILNFPSSVHSLSNNVSFRIYDFVPYNGNFPGKGEVLEDGTVVEEITQQLFFEMKVDGALVASSNMIFEFSTSGNIKDANLTFNPIPYSFECQLNLRNNIMDWTYGFSKNTTTIYKHGLHGECDGNIDSDATIKNMTSTIDIAGIRLFGKTNTTDLMGDMERAIADNSDTLKQKLAVAEAVNHSSSLSIRYCDNVIISEALAEANYSDEDGKWYVDLLYGFEDGSNAFAMDLLHHLYIFECDLQLILKKANHSLI